MRKPALVVLAAWALSGCAVNLLAPYDERTDALVSQMQRNHAAHAAIIQDGQKPACLHSANTTYYRDAHVDVAALQLRAGAIDKNEPTVEQAKALKAALDDFERLDTLAERRGACLSGAELAPIDSGMNQIFGDILKLELAKLRGAKRPG